MSARRFSNLSYFVAAAGLVSLALPIFIFVSGSQVYSPDIEIFARLHVQPEFWARVVLTFAYFPAIIVIHFLAQPTSARLRLVFLAGFSIFLVANGIDAAYRAVQFLTVHGRWAPEIIAATSQASHHRAVENIQVFNDLSPAIVASFSSLFGAGRIIMGIALLGAGGKVSKLTGITLAINGFLNLASVAALAPALAFLSSLGVLYLWVWALGIGLTTALALEQGHRCSYGHEGKMHPRGVMQPVSTMSVICPNLK